jgi:excisionase family DNA binding protein
MDLPTAAKYLGFHPVTLRDWKRKGEGPPGRKVGGRWRFLKSALDAYLWETPMPLPSPSITPTSRARIDIPNPKAHQEYLKALGLALTSKNGSKNRDQ